MTTVTEFVVSAFELASANKIEIKEQWISASKMLGERLPGSLLTVSIQRAGALDAVLRCMEDEFCAEKPAGVAMLATDRLVALSELWVGSVYEVLRLAEERKLLQSEETRSLAHEFRLLRIPMEKHEIAADRSLTAPLAMTRDPADPSASYLYDKMDPLRAHIMPAGISRRGSAQWLAIDPKSPQFQHWIERLALSDRTLHLLTAR